MQRLRLALVFILVSSATARSAPDGDPLFASHELLEATIEAPLTTIMSERSNEEYVPGKFSYVDPDAGEVQFDVGLRTRGRFRRDVETCRFAPLRINFKKSQTNDTVFDKQDKLKLVTHCQDKDARYRQSVVSEYLAYRVFNLLTDISFRARLASVTYVDTDNDSETSTNFAIFIEHADRMAKRIATPTITAERVAVQSLIPEHAALAGLFQYFIGNTDFSPIATSPDKNCCHNHELFGEDMTRLYSIPYDFDMSGFVNAPHGVPNQRFGLRNTRDRLYRGRCVHNEYLAASADLFARKREAIEQLIESESHLSRQRQRSLLWFVGKFYKDIDSPDDRQKNLARDCI